MDKQCFLLQLRRSLNGLPQSDIEDRITFYSEMIDDRMEEGLSEEEAVAGIGSVEEIAAQIVADTPLSSLVKERVRQQRRMGAGEILLLVLGFPLWFPLLIAAFAVLLSVFITLWAVVISLWAACLALLLSGLAGAAGGIVFLCRGTVRTGLVLISAGFILTGLGIFLCCGCKAATKGLLLLMKKTALMIKSFFVRKENAQ